MNPTTAKRRGRLPWWEQKGIQVLCVGFDAFLIRRNRYGYPIGASRVRIDLSEPAGSLATVEREAELMLTKGASRKVADDGGRVLLDVPFAKKYPVLFSYLTQTKWDDGTDRVPATLTIFIDKGVSKVCIKDRDAGLTAWVACPTLTDLFAAAEAVLADPGTEWRTEREQPGDKAKRIKRK